jgi:hexosaminidase
MPLAVRCAISADGRNYQPLGELASPLPEDRWGAILAPFAFECAPTPARYVKLSARNRGTCPAWHKGAGGPAWIFIDEIAVR